jgi:hypothetical protein
MRVISNGLIKIAVFFTKQKILQRIKFVTLDRAMEKFPRIESGPRYLGGGGGGIKDVVEWTKRRYESMPIYHHSTNVLGVLPGVMTQTALLSAPRGAC